MEEEKQFYQKILFNLLQRKDHKGCPLSVEDAIKGAELALDAYKQKFGLNHPTKNASHEEEEEAWTSYRNIKEIVHFVQNRIDFYQQRANSQLVLSDLKDILTLLKS